MVVKFTVFETRGGRTVLEVEPSDFGWQEQSNTPETVNMTFIDEHPDEWRNLFTPWKHSIAVEIGDDQTGFHTLGGPIVPSDLDGNDETLHVSARGLLFLLDQVYILPAPPSGFRPDWLAPDGVPDVSKDTTISGVDRGTIGKKLIQQQMTWPGWGDIPISFHADRAGTRTQTYSAVDRKTIASALSDLTQQLGGPDIRLRLVRTSENSFGWVYESGTEDQPYLQGDVPLSWTPADTTNLSVKVNPSRMGSVFWSEGGRSTDQTLVRMMYDPYLIDRGFPLMHRDTDASSSTSRVETLDAWNAGLARTSRQPWDFWSFDVPVDQAPYPFQYGCGDLAEINLSPRHIVQAGLMSGPKTLSGPGVLSGPFTEVTVPQYLEPRTYTRRIVGMSGSASSEFVKLTCGEFYDAS